MLSKKCIPSPIIFLILALLVNGVQAILMIVKKENIRIIMFFIIANFIFKFVPILTIWPPKAQEESITFGIFLLCIYLLWIYLHNCTLTEIYFSKKFYPLMSFMNNIKLSSNKKS